PRGKARRFDRQVPFAAAEVGDFERRQELTECTRPGGPAASRHQLARIPRVGAAMRVEVLLAKPQDLLEACLVGADDGVGTALLELLLEGRPDGMAAVVLQRRGEPIVG